VHASKFFPKKSVIDSCVFQTLTLQQKLPVEGSEVVTASGSYVLPNTPLATIHRIIMQLIMLDMPHVANTLFTDA
jgi:hypothetical protein